MLSPLSLESQARLGKTTLFCVMIKKQWSRQWRFLFSLNISFISEHKQPLSCSCARCRGGNACYSWLDFTSGKQQPPYSSLCKRHDLATSEIVLNLKERPASRFWVPQSVNVCKTPKTQPGSCILWSVCVRPIGKLEHELKASVEIPLQTDHIYSTATRGAAVSLSISLLDCLS